MTRPRHATTADRSPVGGLPTLRRFAVAVSLGTAVVAAVIIAAETANALADSRQTLSEAAMLGLSAVWVAGVGLVGAILAFRRPENRVSWLFVALAPLLGSLLVGSSLRLTPPGNLAYPIAWLGVVAGFLAIVLAGPVLALVFPEGGLPSRRWRIPVAAATAVFLVCLVGSASAPGQLDELLAADAAPAAPDGGIAALAPIAEALSLGLFGAVLALGALGVAAVVVRRRSGSAVVRAQLSWFLLGASLNVFGIAMSLAESALSADGTALIGPVLLFAGFALTPIGVGIAILRYRLFDIDIVVRRTLTYALVVGVLASVYAVSVLVLQAVVATVTRGEGVAVALSTLLAAAAFQPVRRRVRDGVDRRFHRTHATAREVANALNARLRDQVDPETVAASVVRVAADALQPSHAGVWIRQPASLR